MAMGQTVEPGGIDDCLEIAYPCVERELVDVLIGEAAASLVVAHESSLARESLEQRAPHGRSPIVLDVTEPVRHFHERRAGADRCVGEPDAVGGLTEANLLLHCAP
jgi:hypothetical protein